MKSFWKRALFSAASIALAAAARGERLRTHFDFDALLAQPAFFDFLVLGTPGPARWIVVADDTAPSPPRVAQQVFDSRPDASIAAALRRSALLRDGRWSVAIKQAAAHAGLVFRLSDEKNFLALLVDCGTGDARLLDYRNGKATELSRGRALFQAKWGRLEVTGTGPRVAANWNGQPLLEATDPRPVAGRAGLATEGPGPASFDELVIEPAGDAAGRKP